MSVRDNVGTEGVVPSHRSINVAIVGVGNCASSLVQLIHGDIPKSNKLLRYTGVFANGLIDDVNDIDISICACFDVNANKVGMKLSDAIFSESNCAHQYRDVGSNGVEVSRGPTLDGLGGCLGDHITESRHDVVDVSSVLRDSKCDVVVNLLPTGAIMATEFYAAAAIEAGCGFVNCIPIPIATDPAWIERFVEAGLPVLGDDMKSHIGSTSVHQTLVDLIQSKGGRITNTYQMNIGGNADFLNMTNTTRRAFKNRTKTGAIQSHVNDLVIPDIGPNGFVSELGDNKRAHIMIEAELSLGMRVEMNLNLSVQDSPNAAGVIVPAIISCKAAMLDRNHGALHNESEKYFKMPKYYETDLVG